MARSPAERRARTLIQAGGLVDKAGLLDLDSDALYGALLSLRNGLDNSQPVAR
jgi:Conjugal transfer protein TraD